MRRNRFSQFKLNPIWVESINIMIPVNMVGNERNIEKEGKPFPGKQKQHVEDQVHYVLW